MSKLNLKITNTALNDMELIADFIAKDKKSAAVKMLKLFYKTFKNLSEYPDIGVKKPDFTYKDVLFFVIKNHYLVVYKIHKKNLVILRVLTTYQDICAFVITYTIIYYFLSHILIGSRSRASLISYMVMGVVNSSHCAYCLYDL